MTAANKKKASAVPEGYHSLTPVLTVAGGAAAIDFYTKAFGAKVLMRMDGPGGSVGHAELQIGDSRLMMADEYPTMGSYGPKHYGGSPQSLNLYVADVDAVVARAVAAGATVKRPVTDQFYGERSGSVVDPFGHTWHVGTHIEDVPPDEMQRRAEEWARRTRCSGVIGPTCKGGRSEG